MNRRALAVFVSLSLALLASGSSPAEPALRETWEEAAFGFAIESPGAEWSFVETGARPFKLHVVRADGGGRFGVSVEIAQRGELSAQDFADRAMARIDGQPAYSEVEAFEGQLLGEAVPAVRVHYAQAKESYRIEARYVVEGDQLFELECWAPVAEFGDYEPTFAEVLASFRFVERDSDAVQREQLRALADRCGSELDWAPDWKTAAQRARSEDKPVLVFVWSYRGFSISNSGLTDTFMEPEIIDLVRRHYVPYFWKPGQPAPFVEQTDYGLSGSAFGRALLLVTAEGQVFRETATVHPAWALKFLREPLDELPEPKPSEGFELGLHELRLLMRAGELDQAAKRVDEILESGAEPEGYPEALYWRGVLDGLEGGLAAAEGPWMQLVEEHEEERWAWLAAAALTSTAAELGYPVRPEWPDDEVLRPLRWVPSAPLQPSFSERAEAGALAWLLEEQREDGGWSGTMEIRLEAGRPDPFVDSAVAIAALALLERRDDPSARTAAERALEFVFESIEAAQTLEDRILYMDYTVWSRSWMLWLLATCKTNGFGDRVRIEACSPWLLESLASKQRSNGGWSYYHSNTADGSDSAGEHSISFVSAMVTHALLQAEAAGFEVPETVRDRALDVLETMRNENGTFDYMLGVGGSASGGAQVAGAAGRSPLCELALFRGGRSDEARVAQSLRQFMEYSAELSRELGKALMHAGAEGQGCHYLLFDYAFAALALPYLPESERPGARARIQELILDARSEEGSFQDTPINGWSYGTAMALFGLGRSQED